MGKIWRGWGIASSPDIAMEITYFESAKSVDANTADGAWQDLVDLFSDASTIEHKRSDKLLAPAIIAGRCEGRRANANVKFLSLICADFDIGPEDKRYRTFTQMVADLTAQGLAFIAYTTTSNTQAHNRYRVVMPLERDVLPANWPAVWHAANAKFDGAFDQATKDPARLSFLPAAWAENPFHCPRKGMVTLEQPFNDFASGEGGFILTEAELVVCEAVTSTIAKRTNPQPARVTSTAASPPLQTVSTMCPLAFTMLTSVNGPLVQPWMRYELPLQQGSRTYRFLKAAARRAVSLNLEIDETVLIQLATNWLAEFRKAPPPIDLHRQAANALRYIQQNPTIER